MKTKEFDIKALPNDLKPIGNKLSKLGYGFFKMPQLGNDIYGLSLPPLRGKSSQQVTIVPRSAMRLILTEAARGQLMIKMADKRWGNVIYGRGANWSNVAYAGCGPTSASIIMNYLLRTSPGGSKVGPASRKLLTSIKDFDIDKFISGEDSALNHYPDVKALVLDIVKWAGADPEIRPYINKGTAGKKLAEKLKYKFNGFAADYITNDNNKVVNLLKNGKLLMVGGRQRGWKTRDDLIRNPNTPNAKEYSAHFVVLWGADQTLYNGRTQILWVLDPANKDGSVAIRYTTLAMHTGKSFIHIYRSPSKNLIDCLMAKK